MNEGYLYSRGSLMFNPLLSSFLTDSRITLTSLIMSGTVVKFPNHSQNEFLASET